MVIIDSHSRIETILLCGSVILGVELTVGKNRGREVCGEREAEYVSLICIKSAIAVDEGAAYLGEVALIPVDSPIAKSKTLFYNTLFDENASCHFAFGEAYPTCLKGGDTMTKEELREKGLNDSITHVDFMVGTDDLSITGITFDGEEIPVFVNGKFSELFN